MSGPTLLRPGFLRQVVVNRRKYGPSDAELAQIRPVDYIMSWVERRMMKAGKDLSDRVLILESSTGSGKSTVLPPEYYHRFFETQRKNIACTQPRVLTSVEIPSQSILPYHTREALDKAKFPSRKPLELGKNLGYQNSVLTKKPVRGIIYMTVGVLMQQLNIMSDQDFMDKYGVIFIDEAHERSIGLDITLYLMRRFLLRNYKNPDCPLVIIMSATLDIGKFAEFMLDENGKGLEPAQYASSIIRVEGFTYPIEDHWLKQTSSNYAAEATNLVLQIHTQHYDDFLEGAELAEAEQFLQELKKQGVSLEQAPQAPPREERREKKGGKGGKSEKAEKRSAGKRSANLKLKEQSMANPLHQADILIFVNGALDLKRIKKSVEKLNKHPFFQKYPVMVLELTSDAVTSQNPDYRALFQDARKLLVSLEGPGGSTRLVRPFRRVVVSTNVAETGVTIDTLRYVIDTGFYKSAEYNPCYGVSMLVNKPVTQSMHRQRRGRVGRKGPGFSYSVFTEKCYESMHVMQYPDIAKDQIAADLLTILIREYDSEGLFQSKLSENLGSYNKVITAAAPLNLNELELLDSPSADSLHSALDRLYLLGFVDNNSKPTRLGILASKFRFVSLECIKMILSGYAWGACLPDLITLAAFLQFPKASVFIGRGEEDFAKALRSDEFSLFPGKKERNYQNSEKSRMFMADDFLRLLLIFREVSEKIAELTAEELTAEIPVEDNREAEIIEAEAVEQEKLEKEDKEKDKGEDSEPAKKEAFQTPPGANPPEYQEPAPAVGENAASDLSDRTDRENQPSGDPTFKGGADELRAESDSSDDEIYFGGGVSQKKSHKGHANRARQRSPLEEYLGERGLQSAGFIQVIERRDEIIQMMAGLGLNPYHNWRESLDSVIDASEEEKMTYVKKIKQCLYEGFRANVAVSDGRGHYQTLKSHLSLPLESDLLRYQPKFIIYDSILMVGDSVEMYQPKVNYLGVLDGYVNVDTNFEALIDFS